MSQYDWERGSLIIPRAQWATFKRQLRQAWNRQLAVRVKLATELHDFLKKQDTSIPSFSYSRFVLDAPLPSTIRQYAYGEQDTLEGVLRALIKVEHQSDTVKETLLPLNKKLFRPVNARVRCFTNQTSVLMGFTANISLDDESRKVHWLVREGNHAVERAWEHPFARDFLDLLERVSWGKRGTGGFFFGSDEYNDDAARSGPGQGGSYITKRFGPLGKTASESRY